MQWWQGVVVLLLQQWILTGTEETDGSSRQRLKVSAMADRNRPFVFAETVHTPSPKRYYPSCDDVLPYLYTCSLPEYNEATQQPINCQPDNSFTVTCVTAPAVFCEGNRTSFEKRIENGCSYGVYAHHATALLLSVFCGVLGVDRFYLGYYTIGLIKLFSLGGLFILYIVDVILIALQALEPADGSGYIIPAFGPKTMPQRFSNETFLAKYSCYECS